MRSQVHPDAEESDDDENIPQEDDPDEEDLGMIGGMTNNVFERIAKLIFGFFKAVFRKGTVHHQPTH